MTVDLDIDQIKNLQLAFWQSNIENFLMSKGLPLDTPFEQVTELILKSRYMDNYFLKQYIIEHKENFYNMSAEKIQADLMRNTDLDIPLVIVDLALVGTMLYFLFKK